MRQRLVVASALALLLPSLPAAAAQETSHIVVEGTGEVRVAPDRAVVLLSIETRDPDAQAAAQENARRQARVLDALQDAGLGRDALSTISYGVQPEWEWTERERKLIGYLAQTTIRVRTAELDRVGAFVDLGMEAGVNRVDQISFELSDPEAVRRDALGKAVQNARAAAEAMATAAGGSLGRLLVLTTRGDAAPPPQPTPRMERAMAMAGEFEADTQVVPAEQVVRATVTGRWEFDPGDR